MKPTILIALLLIFSSMAKAEVSCLQIVEDITSFSSNKRNKCETTLPKELLKKIELIGDDDCDLMVTCSEVGNADQCRRGIRSFLDQSANSVQQGDIKWADIVGSVIQYTDGENTASLLASLSYLLPENRQHLSNLINRQPHLRSSIRTIVDPSPDLREIEDRCSYFESILSETIGLDSSEIDLEIDHWARESMYLYQCDQ